MLLKLKERNLLVEVASVQELTNPYADWVFGRLQWGEEQQDVEAFNKEDLCFLSGENLPLCWRDVHYRDMEVIKHRSFAPKGDSGFPYYGS